MGEIEIIKLARAAWTPLGIVALCILIFYLAVKPVLETGSTTRTRTRFLSARLMKHVIDRLWVLALVVIGLAFGAYSLPSLFSDTTLNGVVLFAGTDEPVSGALISVDGLPQINYTTGADGNFSITIPNRKRQEGYTVRGRFSGESVLVATVHVRDADAAKSLAIPIPRPKTTQSIVGSVVDAKTNRVIRQAKVYIEGGSETLTDDDGNFKIELLSEIPTDQSVQLHVEKSGYRPSIVTTTQTSTLNIQLEKAD